MEVHLWHLYELPSEEIAHPRQAAPHRSGSVQRSSPFSPFAQVHPYAATKLVNFALRKDVRLSGGDRTSNTCSHFIQAARASEYATVLRTRIVATLTRSASTPRGVSPSVRRDHHPSCARFWLSNTGSKKTGGTTGGGGAAATTGRPPPPPPPPPFGTYGGYTAEGAPVRYPACVDVPHISRHPHT